MVIYEIGTGYTSIPAKIGAATEIIVEELTTGMQELGNKVTLFDIADDNRLANELPIYEVHIPKMISTTDAKLGLIHKFKRVVYSVALARQLKKAILKEKEQVIIHFHNQYNMYFFLKMTSRKIREKVKIAYTVHSHIWTDEWANIEANIRKRYFQEVYCVKQADYVFVLNDKTKEHFEARLGVDETRIYKIGNVVDTSKYCPLEKCVVDDVMGKLGLSQRKVVFQVGSVCNRKNQLGAINNLKEYLKENREVVYLYAGGIIEQDYQSDIVKWAKNNNISEQIIYLGEIAPGRELNKYYNIADLVVFPSKQESFGMVIIEAIAAGANVLLSTIPIFDLNTGYEVYQTKEEFEELVDKSLRGSENHNSGRKEVIEKYGCSKIANDYCETWE